MLSNYIAQIDKITRLISPEKAFLLLGLIFGCIFCILTPPFQVPDEPAHFYRAYQVSELKFIAEMDNGKVGGYLPASLETIVKPITAGVPFHPEKRVCIPLIFAALGWDLNPDQRSFVEFPNSAIYSAASYAPQALGIGIGRLFGASALQSFYAGRFVNLLLWLVLTAFAIKIIPIGKWLLALCALTPMSVFEAASLSVDPVLNGLAFLFIAMVLRLALSASKRLSLGDMLPIFILAALIPLVKNIYLPLIALFLIIPTNYFGGLRKRLALFAGISILSVSIICIWLSLIYKFTPYMTNPFSASPTDQLKFMIAHPLGFSAAVVNTLKISFVFYVRSYIGYLGWLDTALPMFLYLSQAILIAASCLVAGKSIQKFNLSSLQRVFIAGIFITGLVSILAIEYMCWTPVGATAILGVQGRYLIPYVPLALLSVMPIRQAVSRHSGITGLGFLLAISYILGITCSILFQRYYS